LIPLSQVEETSPTPLVVGVGQIVDSEPLPEEFPIFARTPIFLLVFLRGWGCFSLSRGELSEGLGLFASPTSSVQPLLPEFPQAP